MYLYTTSRALCTSRLSPLVWCWRAAVGMLTALYVLVLYNKVRTVPPAATQLYYFLFFFASDYRTVRTYVRMYKCTYVRMTVPTRKATENKISTGTYQV